MPEAGHYPANDAALAYLLATCSQHGLRRILEVGSGHGSAIGVLAGAGLEVTGIDRDPAMVEQSRAAMAEAGQDPDRIHHADIEDPSTYLPVLARGPYDVVLGLGIMPTVEKPTQALIAMRSLLRPGGHLMLEHRNLLFSLVTFNRHTRDFIIDDLLADVDPSMRERAAAFIEPRLDLERPPRPTSPRPPRYDNPFELPAHYDRAGLPDARAFYFHYHPAAPALEAEDPDFFHSEAMRLEHEDSGWRGMFLCSALLMHAQVRAPH